MYFFCFFPDSLAIYFNVLDLKWNNQMSHSLHWGYIFITCSVWNYTPHLSSHPGTHIVKEQLLYMCGLFCNVKHVMQHTYTPLYDVLATPACVLLDLHLTFTQHLWQLWEKPLVPLDRALKLPTRERKRKRESYAQLNAWVAGIKTGTSVPYAFICSNLDLSCPIPCEILLDCGKLQREERQANSTFDNDCIMKIWYEGFHLMSVISGFIYTHCHGFTPCLLISNLHTALHTAKGHTFPLSWVYPMPSNK